MDRQRLTTYSLQQAKRGHDIAGVLAATLAAVEPGAAIRRHVQREGERLTIDGQIYDLAQYERVFVVGAGKAGLPMAHTVAELLAERLTQGLVIVKDGGGTAPDEHAIAVCLARHPVPDQRGAAATQQIADLLDQTTERDLVLALISGGGSALLTLPAPGITLDDLQALTQALLASGAPINAINCLRKHLDVIKGGGLARLAAPASIVTLVLSDVVGSPLDVIASGPTVPDSTTFADAYAVLRQYNLVGSVPDAIIQRLEAGQRGEVDETPKANNAIFERVQNVLVGTNLQAATAATEAAQQAGFNTLLLTTYAEGEARVVGRLLAAVAREIDATQHPLARPACIIIGGETTVTIRGNGKGGRNQELALAAVRDLTNLPDMLLVTLATDGGDGPTDAAGAVVTGDTLARAMEQNLDVDAALANNDAYPFFDALGDLLKPGPTNTNVNDLAFVFAL